ncbi:MAG TPA: phosphotransferase [Acidimicrobiia bacterium]|nr:phosphotransferase [Acidimicrobiia bacterium]
MSVETDAAPVAPDSAGRRIEPLPADALQRAYDLGLWAEVRAMPAGKSQHYFLTAGLGRFILRRSYRAKQPEGVQFEHELVAHLRAHGFPGPEFVLTRDGEPFAVVDGRLWRVSVFVTGRPARQAHPGDAAAAARALAQYHELVDGFSASVPTPEAPLVPWALADRLAAVIARLDQRPAIPAGEVGASLDYALERAEAVTTRLQELYQTLPMTTIHAGCRRGSTLFDEERLAVVLDFDSAHREARALDVAVAVHDFAKLYGDPESIDYKVHLDPAVAGHFVGAYHAEAPLSAAEVEAIPLLLLAKRLKRALGRYERLLAGEPLSVNDVKKIALEVARVRSLTERDGLVPVLTASTA